MIKPKNIAEKIRRVLEPDKNILLVYLFGSAVTGKYHAGSDIDIGVLLRSCPDRLLCVEESLLLSDKLANALATDKIDLIILNIADPLLSFEVATKGMLVFEQRSGLADEFRLKAVKMHMDARKFFEQDKQAVERFIAEMKPGA
ncbi:MAG: hypothetical protein AUK32_10410 [Candidatus Aquicultor secundus]|uniref:Polymerase beta nucleotidyltransferase domain-containing protein n=2 Tax=Candidatus Aquicultor secundus TaxID=1973895 RepID=A0A2M7T897_9ACTN|nr:nucleotidyltransferase domain-containing protein [Candidatus Aquicultor secundus]OIO83224.1 MAG: hypothetical protein AUK32_10410 [Candidatus Aquicultor secundus]PIY42098.1 MAG: hypothetical protein COZ03_00595 [Candidatus Aquicultor secundus]PIZ39322.1 MAG: hypothetical protein COY37_05075 [Candidatus Aquicultor secundus]